MLRRNSVIWAPRERWLVSHHSHLGRHSGFPALNSNRRNIRSNQHSIRIPLRRRNNNRERPNWTNGSEYAVCFHSGTLQSLTRHPSIHGLSSHGQSLAEEDLVGIASDLEVVHSSFVAVDSLAAGGRRICEVRRVSPRIDMFVEPE